MQAIRTDHSDVLRTVNAKQDHTSAPSEHPDHVAHPGRYNPKYRDPALPAPTPRNNRSVTMVESIEDLLLSVPIPVLMGGTGLALLTALKQESWLNPYALVAAVLSIALYIKEMDRNTTYN